MFNIDASWSDTSVTKIIFQPWCVGTDTDRYVTGLLPPYLLSTAQLCFLFNLLQWNIDPLKLLLSLDGDI